MPPLFQGLWDIVLISEISGQNKLHIGLVLFPHLVIWTSVGLVISGLLHDFQPAILDSIFFSCPVDSGKCHVGEVSGWPSG